MVIAGHKRKGGKHMNALPTAMDAGRYFDKSFLCEELEQRIVLDAEPLAQETANNAQAEAGTVEPLTNWQFVGNGWWYDWDSDWWYNENTQWWYQDYFGEQLWYYAEWQENNGGDPLIYLINAATWQWDDNTGVWAPVGEWYYIGDTTFGPDVWIYQSGSLTYYYSGVYDGYLVEDNQYNAGYASFNLSSYQYVGYLEPWDWSVLV
jgi:hypothetical protein